MICQRINPTEDIQFHFKSMIIVTMQYEGQFKRKDVLFDMMTGSMDLVWNSVVSLGYVYQ
jgi:hypothetical protein